MTSIIAGTNATDARAAGNKAANLAALAAAGFDVPPFFVIDPERFDDASAAVRRELARALFRLGGKRFAVRSSSPEEDGEKASFAGQFASFLDVGADEVPQFASRVIASGSGAHIDLYRRANNLAAGRRPPAVLVQRMVKASASGVAFAADVAAGDAQTAVVAAVAGTGDRLVSGDVQGDTWRVTRTGRIGHRAIEGARPVLSDRQVRRVARLVRRVSRTRGRPQDIEWAFEGRRLRLLQSRDITTPLPSAAGNIALWDNSNIVESYGGITTPLTFSVARGAYAEAYRCLGRAIGVPEGAIRANHQAYEQMIGLIRGRVYYNLVNWYRLLLLTPGFRFNSRFMEQMMGVTEGLPANALPRGDTEGLLPALRSFLGLGAVGFRLGVRLLGHERAVRDFHDKVERMLAPVDLPSMSLVALADYHERLQARVIPAWDAPLVNDLYCMVFHGALRELVKRWLGDECRDIDNDLVAGGEDIISLEPVRRMRRLADIAAADRRLADALCAGSLEAIRKAMAGNGQFERGFAAYVETFGDRCLDELKLESSTLADDPLPCLRAIGQLSRRSAPAALPESPSLRAEQTVLAALAGSPFKRRVFTKVMRLARARVRDRENMRFERTRVYGRVRAVFVEIGRRFAALGMLGDKDDVFYLAVDEILGAVRGTGVSADLAAVARARRREFDAYRDEADLPRRFTTEGPPQLLESMRAVAAPAGAATDDLRRGQACSQGVVRGRVRIVTDPRQAGVREGDILVAQRTDPGWVMIFPLVKGMIMERGSLLSHSAIVARELQIPAVVGVEGACEWLRDGDRVELDGGAGTIRRLSADERAA